MLRAARHLPLVLVQPVIPAERVPEREEGEVRLVHARGLVGAVAAEVEAVAQRGELAAVRDEEVHRRGERHADALSRFAEDSQGRFERPEHLVFARIAAWILELRDEQRIDPLAVRGAADARQELRLHVRREVRLHLGEPGEVAVVRERPLQPLELERVHVLQRDLDRGRVGDAAHVGEHATRRDLGGEVLQVAVEHRQRVRAVEEGLLRRVRGGVPGAQAEAGQVQHVEHLRHVALPHQRRVGLEQQVVEQHRLAEVEKGAAHGAIGPVSSCAAQRCPGW